MLSSRLPVSGCLCWPLVEGKVNTSETRTTVRTTVIPILHNSVFLLNWKCVFYSFLNSFLAVHCTSLTNSSEKIPILNFAFTFPYPPVIARYFLSNNDTKNLDIPKKVWFSFSSNGINIILLTKCLYF